MRFKDFLEEARKNPELNPKISAYEALLPYKDNPDIYISFTDINKVGIRPTSTYNTPLGIYTYPLSVIWKEYNVDSKKSFKEAVPFAGDRDYIQVVRAKKSKGFVEDLYTKYTKKDYEKDKPKIKEMYYDVPGANHKQIDQKMEEEEKKFSKHSYGKLFWTLTRAIAIESGKKQGQTWNSILRKLGYDGFADKSGKGIIHPNEPIQAVFLHKNAFTHVTVVLNKDYKQLSYWKDGTWEDGVWNDGTWLDGIWKDGTWYNGVWKDGTWENGSWLNGKWLGGTWKGGIVKYIKWVDGTWEDGTWYDGKWIKGTWKNGSWKNGIWYKGTWQDGTWRKGTWINGIWEDGIWKNGTWYDGKWKSGTWEHGTWHDGIWESGVWLNGTWERGYIKSKKFNSTIFSEINPALFKIVESIEKYTSSENEFKHYLKTLNILFDEDGLKKHLKRIKE